MIEKIKTECIKCNGTGLYIGFAEPKGTAVVCMQCTGTGCDEINFKPFTRRKDRRGIQKISQSRGSFLGTGVGTTGKYITYQEFKQGKMP